MTTRAQISTVIAERVRSARLAAGLSRKRLAETSDVSERYLHDLESGTANASVGVLVRVAAALSSSLAELIGVGSASVTSPARNPGLEAILAGMDAAEQAGAVAVLERFLAERRRAARGIALIGLRGAGKTTIGRLFSARHDLPFVSVTREVEQRAGMSLGDLFNLGGAEAYRSLENEVIGDLARRDQPIVLETAGGIVGNAEAHDLVLQAFRTVWLKASPEEHLARVASQGDTRPMRGNPRALEHLRTLLADRESEYARAERTLDTSGKSPEACVAELEAIAAPLIG